MRCDMLSLVRRLKLLELMVCMLKSIKQIWMVNGMHFGYNQFFLVSL
ncbi:hypothetical protein Goshw_016091 [Gossypium schwendimanii]|uniref:Uncharacterized protein n=1 Tax=Gossypium schwendimanii TaxID=34291 RepID=A0A7J9LNB1_GOSSC|nr:hypothetical protein [Gossypium schwendimanii]